jgi:hypothetical protein
LADSHRHGVAAQVIQTEHQHLPGVVAEFWKVPDDARRNRLLEGAGWQLPVNEHDLLELLQESSPCPCQRDRITGWSKILPQPADAALCGNPDRVADRPACSPWKTGVVVDDDATEIIGRQATICGGLEMGEGRAKRRVVGVGLHGFMLQMNLTAPP